MKVEVKFRDLDNGVRYYANYDNSSWLSGIGIREGSTSDPPGKTGLRHIVEHLLSKKSKTLSAFDANLFYEKFMGGGDDFKIFTDLTAMFFGHDPLPMRWHMLRCFDVQANMLRDMKISRDDVESEIGVIVEEYGEERVDKIDNFILDTLYTLIYGDSSPIGKRAGREEEEIENITISDVRSFTKNDLVAGNMFFVMLGPSFREVGELANKYFETWPGGSVPRLRQEEYPVFKDIRSESIIRATKRYYVATAFPTETFMSNDAEAIDVLVRIWRFRLEQRLRYMNLDRKKAPYHVDVDAPRTYLHGVVYAQCAVRSEEVAREMVSAMIEEAEKLKRDLVLPEELDAVLFSKEMKHRTIFKNSAGGLADRIIESVCNGDEDLIGLHSYIERLRKINRRKIKHIANKYFTTDAYARVVVGPTEVNF